MLISETHFTDKNYFKVNDYNIYHIQHSCGRAHGGPGIIIIYKIHTMIQATNIMIQDWHSPFAISAILSSEVQSTKRGF